MEQYWLLITLLVTFSIGIVAFTNKIFAEKKYNPQLSAWVLYVYLFIITLIFWAIFGFSSLSEVWLYHSVLAIIWGFQFYLYSVVMIFALRYLPTSTYFLSIRLTSSFILLLIGLFIFWDIITTREYIWFFIWAVAMLFLFECERNSKFDYKKWIYFLWLWIFFVVIWHSITKVLASNLEHILILLLIAFFAASILSFTLGWKHITQNIWQIKGIAQINLIQAFFYFIYFYFLFYVYHFGSLGISYNIQSYSPFIPIILAAIIYREHISLQRGIGIFLSALSLYFFI